MKKITLAALLVLLAYFSALAQKGQGNAELANQYLSTGEVEKAVVYFEKFYDDDPFSAYPGYLQCLLKLSENERAEKLIRKQQKKFPQDPAFKVDLGDLYASMGQTEKASRTYGDAIRNLPADVNIINLLGNAFSKRQMFDYAIEAFREGRKQMKGAYPFSFELGEVYAQAGKFPEMVNEYVEMISFNPGYLPNIQTILQNKMANDLSGGITELVRQALLRRIQKEPDEISYTELLLWLFLQEKDFESAFIQARGIDRRLNESGERILNLGRTCVSNQDYETAEKCFRYVAEKGSSGPHYVSARMEMINAANDRLTRTGSYTREDLLRLDSDYRAAINELGRSAVTAPLIRGYAHLQAFFLHNSDSAITLINETLELPNLSSQFRAECKLELGDIYVFNNDVWDAALVYGQVDKDFKNDALGREAKFRNARLSYYIGEFDWAKDQLNVLKAATSQLISNDALALALLISDNTNLDTSTQALLMYARADLLDFQNKDSLAMLSLDSLLVTFTEHSLTDEVWYKKASILKVRGRYEEAAGFYGKILEKYPEDILADDAMYQMGLIYEGPLDDKEKAKTVFEEFLTRFPGSLFAVDARRHFRSLRGDKLN